MAQSRADWRPNDEADPALRRLYGLDLDADSWLSRLRGYCAGPPLGMLGPYELLATAGRGGQGLVFKARQPRTGREVAIKRLAAGRFSTPEMHARFQREVEAVAALEHPHIVTVFGSDMADGQPVLVMQWIDGVPFDRWARPADGVTRPVWEVLDAFVKVCDAVDHAHQRGVIHRDLKPSNVLVDGAGQPHVLDFGLARRDSDSSDAPQLTLSGALLGTPAFSPPEQLRGAARTVDERSDVYSLGATLFRALTGSAPVDPQLSHTGMAERLERLGPPSPVRLNPSLDREVSAVLLKALQPEPAQRYHSVDALAEDVRRYRSGRPVHAHPPGAAYRLRKFSRRNWRALLAAGVLLVAVVIGLVQSLRMYDALDRESRTRREVERADASRALDENFNAAVKLEQQGRRAEAEALYRDVLARRRALLGDDHVSIVPVAVRLGKLLSARLSAEAKRLREAEPVLQLGFAASLRHYGADHAATFDAGLELARVRIGLANYRGAEEVCRTLPTDSDYARNLAADSWIFRPLLLQCRFKEAIGPMQLALVFTRRRYGDAHRLTAGDLYMCGEMLRRAGDESGARARFEEALAILIPLVEESRSTAAPSNEATLRRISLGSVLLRLGRADEAERVLQIASEAEHPNDAMGRLRSGLAMIALGECLLHTGRADEGERLLVTGQGLARDYSYLPARFLAILALIEHYDATGQTVEAAHWRDCLARRPFCEWGPPGQSGPTSSPTGPTSSSADETG